MTDKEKLEAVRAEIHRLVDVRGYDREMANDLFAFMDSLPNEPVSEELEEASKEWLAPQLDKSYANYGEVKMMELTHFDGYAMLDAIEFGAQWQKEQDQSTIELAEDHAMLAGMEKMKEEMMAKAIDGKIHETQARSKLKAVTTGNLSRLDYKVDDKVKVIVIKED
jgi:hypothetical protein